MGRRVTGRASRFALFSACVIAAGCTVSRSGLSPDASLDARASDSAVDGRLDGAVVDGANDGPTDTQADVALDSRDAEAAVPDVVDATVADTPDVRDTGLPPSCTDGMRNGSESDTDCGGDLCPRCRSAQSCVTTTDCTPNATCGPTLTGFRCACLAGFDADSTGACRDIDECGDPMRCDARARCANTPGSFTCTCRSGYIGTGAPGGCATVCGDGLIRTPEECDDANVFAGDGCSAACTIESNTACSAEPSVCTRDATPDAFTFTDVVGAAPATMVRSNEITLSGFFGEVTASVDAGATLIVNGMSRGSSTTVRPGDTVSVSATSADTGGVTTVISVTIGGFTDLWSITTGVACVPQRRVVDADNTIDVIPGCTRLQIDAWGGGGGGGGGFRGAGASGGGGAYVTATVSLGRTSRIRVVVGIGGAVGLNDGELGSGTPGASGGGGGGGTSVTIDGDMVVLAGGGGGGGGGRNAGRGGAGGATGANGTADSGGEGRGGRGATSTAPGAGGAGRTSGRAGAGRAGGQGGGSGSATVGGGAGDGFGGGAVFATDDGGGGGGGGGFFGGGGGGQGRDGGGGGGGSSFVLSGAGTISDGSGATPGNPASGDRGSAGEGRVSAAGNSGRVVLRFMP